MNRNRIMVVVGIALLLAVLASVGRTSFSPGKVGWRSRPAPDRGNRRRDGRHTPRFDDQPEPGGGFTVAERIVPERRHRRSKVIAGRIACGTLPAVSRSWSRSWCP